MILCQKSGGCLTIIIFYPLLSSSPLVNMANTVDDYDFDEEDTMTSRNRLSTTVNLTPSDYLHKHRQAIFSNVSRDDGDEDTTSL